MTGPVASIDEKKYLKKLESDLIEQDEEPTLDSILELLKPACVFTDYVCGDHLPALSDVYSRIHEMISKASKIITTNSIIENFWDNLVREMETRWNTETIPNIILIPAFLNPSSMNNSFFANAVQIDDQRVTIRHHARGCVLKALLAMERASNLVKSSGASLNDQY